MQDIEAVPGPCDVRSGTRAHRSRALARSERDSKGVARKSNTSPTMKRAKDCRVYAQQPGRDYFAGPMPDTRTECLIMKFLDKPEQEE